jgi:hypothetical protein
MKPLRTFLFSGLVAVGLSACQKDDSAVVKKLDEIAGLERQQLDKLTSLEKQLASGGRPGAARPQPGGPQPGSPDATAVYAVPVEGAPSRGNKNAKVTIIAAFEFA